VLAQIWIQNCSLPRAVSLQPRRSARPSQNPYIAAGQTVAGQTAWTALDIGGAILGVAVDVDTSAARFRSTPRYMAHVVGDRTLPPSGPLVLAFPVVSGATPERFTLRVLLPDMSPQPHNPSALRHPTQGPSLVRTTLQWRVAWMGVEG
jgi:hypothetical protein